MTWGMIGAASVGALVSTTASKRAVSAAEAGQTEAAGLTREQMAQQETQYRELLALGEPYRAAGERGLVEYERLAADPSAIYEDPTYQALVAEGGRAIESSAAARGTQLSGRTLAGLQEMGQTTAAQYRGQIMGELANLANIGSTAVGQAYGVGGAQMAQTGQAYGGLSTLAQQTGQIQAGAEMGAGGALTQLAGTLGSAYIRGQQPSSTVPIPGGGTAASASVNPLAYAP